jgi:ammonium transporter, Amt family
MVSAGDTAFLLLCTAMVLLMTPALALFYGGLVRKTDILTTMIQTFICLGLVTVIWVLGGFSLVFGPDIGHIIGNPLTFLGMRGIGGQANAKYAATIPFIVFFAYQMMFAIITPALVTGSFVSRFRFTSYIWFVLLWTAFIYLPVAHWIWGSGFLAKLGVVDFAGGLVVHTTAGLSALTVAKLLGPRRDGDRSAAASNIPLVAVGAGLLWFGWFGFNSGGAYRANALASYAFVNTTLSASTALLVWLFWYWRDNKRESFSAVLVGAVAGLATITPAAGYVKPWAALMIGGIGASACYFAKVLQTSLKIDDALEVFRAHGVGGITGSLLIGIFATKAIDGVSGSARQFLIQLFATIVVAAYSVVVTWLIMKTLNTVGPVRVSAEEEARGLDREEAYHLGIALSETTPDRVVVSEN